MQEYNQESIKMNETKQEIKLDCDFDNTAIACCALDTEKPG